MRLRVCAKRSAVMFTMSPAPSEWIDELVRSSCTLDRALAVHVFRKTPWRCGNWATVFITDEDCRRRNRGQPAATVIDDSENRRPCEWFGRQARSGTGAGL